MSTEEADGPPKDANRAADAGSTVGGAGAGSEVDRLAAALLRFARAVATTSAVPDQVGVRTAALLSRIAVERVVAEVLRQALPGAEQGSLRAQLLCLRSLDARLGEDAAFLHGELSRACHHQPYELGPTVDEVLALLERTGDVTRRLATAPPGSATSTPSTPAGTRTRPAAPPADGLTQTHLDV